MATSLVSTGVTFPDGSTQTTRAAQVPAFTNRIINGAMVIDQRNAGASVAINPASNGNIFTVDRFRYGLFGSTYSATAVNVQQSTDAPSGFVNSLRVTSASTITPDSNKLGSFFTQNIEGFNVADLGWGAAGAAAITISFWVKASRTGTMSVAVENSSGGRSYITTVSISSANTWEYKTATIAGDTTGTWEKGNGIGISAVFGVMSNGSWLAGTGGAWSSARAIISTSQTNFIAASSDYIAITGVQLEKGSTATSFDYRPYGTELALCQRYFQLQVNQSAWGISANGALIKFSPFVQMRATPTLAIKGAGSYSSTTVYYESAPWLTVGTLTGASALASHITAYGGDIQINGTYSSLSVNQTVVLFNQNTPESGVANQSYLTISAEL